MNLLPYYIHMPNEFDSYSHGRICVYTRVVMCIRGFLKIITKYLKLPIDL